MKQEPDRALTVTITFRASEFERDAYKKAADANGWRKSTWMRQVLLRAARKGA